MRKTGMALAAALALTASAAYAAQKAATPEEAVKQLETALKAADVDGVLDVFGPGVTKFLQDSHDGRQSLLKAEDEMHQAVDAKFGADESKPGLKRPRFVAKTMKEELKEEFQRTSGRFERFEVTEKKVVNENRVDLLIAFHEKSAAAAAKKGEDGKVDQGKVDERKKGDDEKKAFTPRPEPWTALKQDGAWKLVPRGLADKPAGGDDFGKKFREERLAKYQKYTQEVKDGKYKTRDEFMEAFYGFSVKRSDTKKGGDDVKGDPKPSDPKK